MPLRSLSLLVLLTLYGCVRADEVLLRNGNSVRGQIVREDEEAITLRLPYGTMWIRRDDILEIRRDTHLANLEAAIRVALRGGQYRRAESLARDLAAVLEPERRGPELAHWLVRISDALLADWQVQEAGRLLIRAGELAPRAELVAKGSRRYRDALRRAEGLLHQARSHLEPGAASLDPTAAANLLEPLLACDLPLGDEIRRTHAIALAHQGALWLRQGEVLRTVTLLERALTVAPDAGQEVVDLYVISRCLAAREAQEQGHHGSALTHVQLALETAPASLEAHYMRGQLLQLQGSHHRAIQDYQLVLGERGRIPPSAAVAEELRQRAGELVSFTVTLRPPPPQVAALDGESIVLATHDGGDVVTLAPSRALAQQVTRTLQLSRARVRTLLGLPDLDDTFRVPLHVYIHRSREACQEASGQGYPAAGYSLYRADRHGALHSHEIHSWAGHRDLISVVLPHELAHILTFQATGYRGDLPRWLGEGVAILAEPNHARQSRLGRVRRHLARGSHIPLQELLATTRYPTDPDRAQLFYAESFSVVAYLQATYGHARLLRFLKGSVDGTAAAFESAFGTVLEPTRLERLWSSWLLG